MAYEIVSERPAAVGLGKASPGPPFKFACDITCPFLPFECQGRKKELCERILGAIDLAGGAAFKLETKPPSQGTLSWFHQIFDQSPFDRWEIPWAPRRTMVAGDMAAHRFRAVEKELRARETLYRCASKPCAGSGSGAQPEAEPSHPTETIVRDRVAWAVLCKDEVWLCPPFWQMKKEWQEGTILHEMFHLCFGLTCAWFQHDAKERKRNNAYCYEAFALSVADQGYVPEPITYKKCHDSPR